MGSVRELYRHPEKGVHIRTDTLCVTAGGAEGDRAFDSGERQICLCAGDVMDSLAASAGLCARRFCPNVVTDGLTYDSLVPGQSLRIGSAVFSVSRVGKACFPACTLDKGMCALRTGCAFLTVRAAGPIRVGDTVE